MARLEVLVMPVAIGRPEAYYDGHGEERAGKGQRIIRIVAVESEDR